MPTTTDAAALLTGFRLRNAERNLGVYGVHVHREGHEPIEHRFRNDDPVNIYSGAKTFTALAVGIAVHEDLLQLDDALVDFFPAYTREAADGMAQVTVRHLLQMTDGSPFTWFEPGQLDTDDLARSFLTTPLASEPGSRFEYSNGSTYMLGRIIHAVSGQDLRDYLEPRLFAPLGIRNPQWMRCPHGFSLAGTGLYLRTAEYARLGRLLLQDGRWEDTPLVSADFVARMHTDVVDSEEWAADPESAVGYGYQVWRCTRDGAWRADGKYGQFCVVLPRHRAVVTVTAHNEGVANDILRAVWVEILPLLPEHAD